MDSLETRDGGVHFSPGRSHCTSWMDNIMCNDSCDFIFLAHNCMLGCILILPATISVEVWSENVSPRDQSLGLREKEEGWKRTERAPTTVLYFHRNVASFYLVKIVSLHHLVGSHHL